MKPDHFKVIGFDADDTLWVNEPYYRETESEFYELLKSYLPAEELETELFRIEIANLGLYGYGAKGFMLSMIETALKISGKNVSQNIIGEIIQLGRNLINRPVILLDGVQETLDDMYTKGYKLIVVTKGDLLDQERKLEKSNIEKYFHHIEVVSDKKEVNYLKLLSHLDILPEDFLMIGNSLKSDIIPILNIGGSAIHIPYHTTWQHEEADKVENQERFLELKSIQEVIKHISGCKEERQKVKRIS